MSTESLLEQLRPVADGLEAEAEELARRQVIAVRRELISYTTLPESLLHTSALRNVRRVVASLRDGRGPASTEIHEAAGARERAEQGIPAEDVLRGYRLCLRILRDAFIYSATELHIDPATILYGTHLLWEVVDTVTLRLTEVRREVEIEKARNDEHQRLDFLRGLLFGSLSMPELRKRAATYGLALDRPYLALRGRAGPQVAIETLKRIVETTAKIDRLPAFIGVIDGDLAGIAPRRPQMTNLAATLGVGSLVNLELISLSFQTASRVLDVSIQFHRQGVFGLDDLSIQVAVASEQELGQLLLRRYIEPLEIEGEFGELLEMTVREFLACGQQVQKTSQRLVIHPNTLRYRLSRFEKLTGADLSQPLCMVEVWWALERKKLEHTIRESPLS